MKVLRKIGLIFAFLTMTLQALTIDTPQYQFQVGASVPVLLTELPANAEDWVGIYPQGVSNDWDNIVDWSFTNGMVDGTINFDNLPAGTYEARIFFNNSFDLEATTQFLVEGNGGGGQGQASVTTSQATYQVGEAIDITVSNMAANAEDWVGIYPQGSSNDWDNVRSWSFTNGIADGALSLDSVPAGDYEVRVFFNNSFNLEAVAQFTVAGHGGGGGGDAVTMYEDAENGGNENWTVILGNNAPSIITGGYQSEHLVHLIANWINDHENTSEYWLYTANDTKTILEMDIGGVGRKMPHFFIGVQAITEHGERSIIWDSYFNHEHIDPFIADYGNGNIELGFPSPVEHVRGWGYEDLNVWGHFRVDIQAALRQLEPDNSIISIKALKFSGGFLDNIKLSVQ